MDADRHIVRLEAEGRLLAEAAERAGLDAPVPSCAPWRVRDLLRHQGYVHRWAAAYVSVPIRAEAPELTEAEQLAGGAPDDRLLEWFRYGYAALAQTLRVADPGVICWTFLDAPSPLAFWARRQAHETAIHRADAQLAAGEAPGYAPDFAADGVDELIMGFLGRQDAHPGEPGGTRLGEPALDRTLLIRATDTGQQWRAELSADGRRAARVGRGPGPAACTLDGPASGLYQVLWNRSGAGPAGVTVSGDDGLAAAWRAGMHVRW
jgi:uncharacterized protein (TIGR03083 family)